MERSPKHQLFIDHISGKLPDNLPRKQKTIATPQELIWWNEFQWVRITNHVSQNNATPPEIKYWKKHWPEHSTHLNNRKK